MALDSQTNGVPGKLAGKVAVVTGGGAGMGRSVALRFAREGARVAIAELDAQRGQEAAAAIRQQGGEADFIRTDVAEENDVRQMASFAEQRYGAVDILYNNAAVLFHGREGRAHELTTEIWDRTQAVNLRGMWLVARYVIPLILKKGGGSIIIVGSPTGLTGCGAGLTAYSASKGGVNALARVMAVDYAPDNIRVNCIIPGTMATPMNEIFLSDEHTRSELTARIPLARLGTPDDVSGLAVFLASDDSAYCTGGFFMADGGLTAV